MVSRGFMPSPAPLTSWTFSSSSKISLAPISHAQVGKARCLSGTATLCLPGYPGRSQHPATSDILGHHSPQDHGEK